MLVVVAQALFFFLPAYVANMCPVILGNVRCLQFLKKPIDGGRRFGSGRLFGEHKTYLGFVAGVLGASLTGIVQYLIFWGIPQIRWIFLFEYSPVSALLAGFMLGLGALSGDLVKSFIKRRLGKKDGESFFPFDQLDFVIGGLLAGSAVYFPSWSHVAVLIILTPVLHLLSNIAGFKLGLKKVWW
jgi:CDP-2,3-bis-(O-geranylgeranyl)-sn-glycerol synthase